MAHIFKHPEGKNKGIVVFTHKEIFYFVKYWKKTRFEALNHLQDKLMPKTELQVFFKNHFKKIREKYLVGMHFGWYQHDQPTYDFVDFYMAGKGTVSWKEGSDPFHIPMNSRNFIEPFYENRHYQQKYWDLICVASVNRIKNMDLLLKSIRKIYDLGKMIKVLLVVPSKHSEPEKKFYTHLIDDYKEMFSEEERKYLTIIKLSRELSFMGMSQYQMVHFYNSSKVFTLFTQLEGESRVIAEALLCGLPVVVKDDLTGGGRDYLNESNSLQFDSYENAHQTLINAIENYEKLIPSEDLVKELRSDQSIFLLKDWFGKLYERNGMNFDGELINCDRLDLRLPGHFPDLPWMNYKTMTADIFEKSQFRNFVSELHLK